MSNYFLARARTNKTNGSSQSSSIQPNRKILIAPLPPTSNSTFYTHCTPTTGLDLNYSYKVTAFIKFLTDLLTLIMPLANSLLAVKSCFNISWYCINLSFWLNDSLPAKFKTSIGKLSLARVPLLCEDAYDTTMAFSSTYRLREQSSFVR